MSIEVRAKALAKALMRQLGRSKQASPPHKLHRIGDHEIMLTGQHELPLHQLHHRLYDRFPISLGLAQSHGWIVDIGANVGDSAAAFVSGSPKQMLCIEPVTQFYSLLEKNAARLRAAGTNIICLNTCVGPEGSAGHISAGQTTASLSTNGASTSFMTLDSIAATRLPRDATIGMIKCDVDGFDSTALMSGLGVITRDQPLIYFECEVREKETLVRIRELCDRLASIGYDMFTLFDNFGLLMIENAPLDVVSNCLQYVYWQNEGRSTRCINYFDIAASSQRSRALHLAALDHYRRTWLNE
jgi:FkbM family methyltransferase